MMHTGNRAPRKTRCNPQPSRSRKEVGSSRCCERCSRLWQARRLGSRPNWCIEPDRLLEVASGNGDFVVQAKQASWQIFGQDFDATAAGIGRSKTGSEVRVGGLQDVAFSFDAVRMSNVFEHMPDPRETLAEIRRILKPNGMLLSTSLNPESYLHKKHGQHRRGLEVPRHLYLFSLGANKAFCGQVVFARIEAFPTLGAFDFMEHASAQIGGQRSARPAIASGKFATGASRRLCGHPGRSWNRRMDGRDPRQARTTPLQLPACLTDAALV